jgi:hypothetical protein
VGALTRSLATCLAVAALAAAAPARAQGDPSAIADALFADAKRLLEAGKVDQACPKFAESLRLAPTLGTRLNLARCYEVQGKTASAWGQYKEVVRTGGDDTKRVDIAKERVSTLEQVLSRVTIQGSADVGLQLKLDGQVLDAAVLGTAFAIDPGDHALEVSAPNKQPASVKFHVDVAKSASVDLPRLAPTTTAPEGPDTSPTTQTPEQPKAEVASGKRTGGFVTIGVGGALLVAGAVFGGVTIALASDVRAACPDVVCTNQDALSKNSTAHTLAVLSDVLIPLGLVAIGVGAYLVVTSPRRASIALAPTFGPGSGGLSLAGRF